MSNAFCTRIRAAQLVPATAFAGFPIMREYPDTPVLDLSFDLSSENAHQPALLGAHTLATAGGPLGILMLRFGTQLLNVLLYPRDKALVEAMAYWERCGFFPVAMQVDGRLGLNRLPLAALDYLKVLASEGHKNPMSAKAFFLHAHQLIQQRTLEARLASISSDIKCPLTATVNILATDEVAKAAQFFGAQQVARFASADTSTGS